MGGESFNSDHVSSRLLCGRSNILSSVPVQFLNEKFMKNFQEEKMLREKF